MRGERSRRIELAEAPSSRERVSSALEPCSAGGRPRGSRPGSSACAARRSKRRRTRSRACGARSTSGSTASRYDVRACATGEIAAPARRDARPHDRRTRAPRGRRRSPSLAALDAGVWFGARFRGEPLALLEEAPWTSRFPTAAEPRHVAWLREAGLVPEVTPRSCAASNVRRCSSPRSIARDVPRGPRRRARIDARRSRGERGGARFRARTSASAPARVESGTFDPSGDWRCERWSARRGFPGGAPRRVPDAARRNRHARAAPRARDARARARSHRSSAGRIPCSSQSSRCTPDERGGPAADWCGSWNCAASVRNPFPFAVEVDRRPRPAPRRVRDGGPAPPARDRPRARSSASSSGSREDPGASEVTRSSSSSIAGRRSKGRPCREPPPRRAARARAHGDRGLPRAAADAPARIPERSAGVDDPPPARPRSLRRDRERGRARATRARSLLLDGRHVRGGRGVRARLPEDFDARSEGIPFSCGIEASSGGERLVRRFAGGIPDEDGAGAPGRLVPLGAA